MSFVHLHTHSEYSLLDGHAKVARLVARAVELDMPALALTDHGAMFGAVEFHKAAGRAGIKPILGCEVYFTPGSRGRRDGKPQLYHLVLLASDLTGYRNLMAMVSEAHVGGFYYKPQVDQELLRTYSQGLIATSGCMSGVISKSFETGVPEEARRWAEFYAGVFGEDRFFIEIQDQGIVGEGGVTQRSLNEAMAGLAAEMGLGLVATNDVHYVDADDSEAQDMLVCIQTGSTLDETERLRFSSDQFYMKSAAEMELLMGAYPEALRNTVTIAERCEVDLEFDRVILPVYEVPSGHTTDTYLEERCAEGLVHRYGDPVPLQALERLRQELDVIEEKGFAGYFLVVQDFVKWAKERGIGVGPGRGSAAGSIISYTLGITDLDPLGHGLLFERFLNPERHEMPDIDIDFDDERRDEVIDYVRRRYGDDKVAQVITFNRMKARAAVRDAGRVLGYPFGVPDKVARQIIDMPAATIGSSLAANPDLRGEYEAGGDTARIVDAAQRLEGIVRGEGVHPAAVVICRDPLHHHTPVKRDTKGEAVITQYEGAVIAELGLLKMDLLGLRTLTVIADASRQVAENHGIEVDLENLPLDDAKTWELYQRGDVAGVFQVESPGMRGVLTSLKPTCFADLVAVVALYRPGPMDIIPRFIARKHGREEIGYYHDDVRHILEETYGFMVYQEQAMRIAMELAGFSGAKADKLRKGMGKKVREIMDALHPEFIEGALSRGYDRRLAESVWSDMEKFGEYAFNKSHAAAYALVSYRTAYLKAHWPLEFMAAVLNSHVGKSERIVRYVAECKAAGIAVLPPDVNSSGARFTVVEGAIRFGLAGIRNVGEGVVETIVAGRREGGDFASLQDFCSRVEMQRVNKRTVEALIKAGAFDSTGYARKHLMSMMDTCVDSGLKRQRDAVSNQISMFDLDGADDHGFTEAIPEPNGDEWDDRIKLAFEKEMLGIYVSDHPLREMAETIKRARTDSLGDSEEFSDGKTGWFAGMITSPETIVTKAGKMMASFVLEDLEGSMEALLFPQTYERFRDLLVEDEVVRVKAKVEKSDRGPRLMIQEMQRLGDVELPPPPRVLVLSAGLDLLERGGGTRLKGILARHPGRDEVRVCVQDPDDPRTYRMPERVDMSSVTLLSELQDMLGPNAFGTA